MKRQEERPRRRRRRRRRHPRSRKKKPHSGFGKYIGVDGKAHVGIEKHPLVVPLDIKALEGVRKREKKGMWHLKRRNQEGETPHAGREEGSEEGEENRISADVESRIERVGLHCD